MANTNLVTNLNADLLDGYHASSLLKDITTNYRTTITSANDYPTDLLSGIHRVHISNVEYASILTGYDYDGKYWQLRFRPSDDRNIYYRNSASSSWSTIAFRDSNVASATKLQTARTIAGVSFDGTANIAIPFANLSSKPTTLAGYGITDAYTKTEVDTALALKLNKSIFDDLFEKVEVSTGVFAIKAKYSFYSTGEVSAYGIGSGGSGGGSYDRLDAWADYDSTKEGWVLSALLGVDLNTRVGNLEGGSALTVNTTGTGNAITSISKAGTVITATKGATFSLSNHLHSASDITSGTFAIARIPTGITGTTVALGNHLHTGIYEPVFTKNAAFNKNFGTTAGTVAEGNDSRINNGQTAFGWGNHSGLYLPLAGGTMTNTNLVTNLNADLLDGHNANQAAVADTIAVRDSNRAISMSSVKYSPASKNISTQGWYRVYAGPGSEENVIINIARNFYTNNDESYSFSISKAYNSPPSIVQISGRANTRLITYIRVDYTTSAMYIDFFYNSNNINGIYISGSGRSDFQSPTLVSTPSGAVTEFATVNGVGSNFGFTGDLTGNATSATKLQTPRTIAGVSFDGTANIAIPFANLSSKPTTLGGYGITDAVTLNTAQTISGAKTFSSALTAPSFIGALSGNATTATKLQTSRTIWGQSFDGSGNVTGALIGATTIQATISVASPKVIFNAAGWSMEQVGSELQMKHNNVLKMRFTSTGSIIATEEITAFG
jgi:hypothetical protein